MLASSNESVLAQRVLPMVVIDLPDAMPLSVFCPLRPDSLWRFLIDKDIPHPSVSYVAAQCSSDNGCKQDHARSAFSCDADSSLTEINVFDPHGSELSGATAGAIKNFYQRAFVLSSCRRKNRSQFLFCENLRNVPGQPSQLDCSGRNPLQQPAKIEEVKENAQGIQFPANGFRGGAPGSGGREKFLNVEMVGAQYAPSTAECYELFDATNIVVPRL